MNNTEAIDLGLSRRAFTWTNRREGLANIKERLDQCFCDQECQTIFPKAGIRHLSNSNSDHNPILMDTYMEDIAPNRPFQFEAMWTKEESSKEVVENAWLTFVEGSQGYRLARKLDATRRDLKRWNKKCFGNSRERIKELEAKIARLQVSNRTRENLKLEASLNLELDDWLEREDLKWKQKSREFWTKESDRNTRFFHLSTLVRRRRNCINEIKLEDGSWINTREEIQNYFNENFKSLYQSKCNDVPEDLENLIEPCISEEENEELCRVPSRE